MINTSLLERVHATYHVEVLQNPFGKILILLAHLHLLSLALLNVIVPYIILCHKI